MANKKTRKPSRRSDDEKEKLRKLYEKSRREFTAADLQKYTVIEKGIPFEEILEGLEDTHRKARRKRA